MARVTDSTVVNIRSNNDSVVATTRVDNNNNNNDSTVNETGNDNSNNFYTNSLLAFVWA